MRISTKGRYAIRLMLDLAIHGNGDPIRLKDVALRQSVSEKYLEQIISVLHEAGYVRSIRGPQGGYRLAKDPSEYTTGMILRLTEGALSPVDCIGESGLCERQENCATRLLWQKLDDAINSVVDHVTLQDLMNWQEGAGDDYVI